MDLIVGESRVPRTSGGGVRGVFRVRLDSCRGRDGKGPGQEYHFTRVVDRNRRDVTTRATP